MLNSNYSSIHDEDTHGKIREDAGTRVRRRPGRNMQSPALSPFPNRQDGPQTILHRALGKGKTFGLITCGRFSEDACMLRKSPKASNPPSRCSEGLIGACWRQCRVRSHKDLDHPTAVWLMGFDPLRILLSLGALFANVERTMFFFCTAKPANGQKNQEKSGKTFSTPHGEDFLLEGVFSGV